MPLNSSATIVNEQVAGVTTPARDFGHQIGIDYWRTTPHVFSPQGKDKPCGLCYGSGQHIAAEPEPPQPSFTEIIDRSSRDGYYRFDGALSCGHGPIHMEVLPKQCPKVGDTYDCWDCTRPVRDRNHPGLPEDVREQIESHLPKCPECGGGIDTIPFIKRTVHKFAVDVDFQTGEIMASSEHDGTIEEVPDWHKITGWGTYQIGEIEVACAQGHGWFETRMAYRYRGGEHEWTVLRPKS